MIFVSILSPLFFPWRAKTPACCCSSTANIWGTIDLVMASMYKPLSRKRVDCCDFCEKMGMLRIRQIFILHTHQDPPDARTTAHTAHRKNRRRLSKHASRHCTAWCAARAHALFGRPVSRRSVGMPRAAHSSSSSSQPHRSNSVQGQGHHHGSKVYLKIVKNINILNISPGPS